MDVPLNTSDITLDALTTGLSTPVTVPPLYDSHGDFMYHVKCQWFPESTVTYNSTIQNTARYEIVSSQPRNWCGKNEKVKPSLPLTPNLLSVR
jgi:hypothetical protein